MSSPRPQIAGTVPVSNLLDLELLHNFSTKTCLTLTSHAPLQEFYQTTFISEALRADYLLHCLLGLSAFHLAQQHREMLDVVDEQQKSTVRSKVGEYLVAAHTHHNAGLSTFRQTLTSITPENCHTLFASSILIAGTSFALPWDGGMLLSEPVSNSYTTQDSVSTIPEWLLMLRGIRIILTEARRDWIEAGPMSPILKSREYESYGKNIGQVDEDTAVYLDSLCAYFVQYSNPHVCDACITAIELLRKSFAGIAGGCDPSVVFFWPAQVSADFLTVLEGNTPEALLVLASFCMLMDTLSWCWLFQGWSPNMLKAIEGMLDTKWKQWLSWPLQVVTNNGARQLKGPILAVIEGRCCS